MTLKTVVEGIMMAVYATIGAGIVALFIGWLVSKTIRPGYQVWVLFLIPVGLVIALVVAIGAPIITIELNQMGWMWLLKVVMAIVSIAMSILLYWRGLCSSAIE